MKLENQIKEKKKPCYRDRNLQIVFLVSLMAVMGFAEITPALPRMIKELNMPAQSIGLVIVMFTLPGILLTPFIGILSDRCGRKKILVPSLILFGIVGTACAFVRDFNLLLGLRFLQGTAASALTFLNFTIVGDLYTGDECTAAHGYNASFLSIGMIIYPAIGGALATAGWHYPFLISVSGIPVGLLVWFFLKNPERKIDQDIKEYLTDAGKSIKKRGVIWLYFTTVVTFTLLLGPYLTYFPILAGNSFGASPFVIGIMLSTTFITFTFVSSQLGKLAKAYSERNLITTAFFLYSVSLISITLVPNIWLLLIPTIAVGIAQAIAWPSIIALLSGLTPMKQRGLFLSVNGAIMRTGQTLGPLLMGVVFGLWGLSSVFLVGAGLSFAMFVLAFFVNRALDK
jgi:ACDE family multidrug resistance protein